jgi:hypothetical protein
MNWLVELFDELHARTRESALLSFSDAALQADYTPLQEGHRTIDAVRADLVLFDSDKQYRSADQVRMQEFFLAACARRIYGAAYAAHKLAIMEYNNWASIEVRVCASTPRRWGKTWAMAMLIAALFKNVVGINVGIFSTGIRTGGKDDGILGHIINNLAILGVTQFEKNDGEHLFLKCKGAVNKIRVYPKVTAAYVFALFRTTPLLLREDSTHGQRLMSNCSPRGPFDMATPR